MAKPTLGFLPTLLCLISFILILVILLGGVRNGLADIFFLKINSAAFKLRPLLEDVQILQQISETSGIDFIGGDITASTLGIADEYTVSLLTFCARTASGPSCAPPRLDFWFSPGSVLHLDAALSRTYTDPYVAAVSSYERVASKFLPGAYVFCALAVGLTAILSGLAAGGVARTATGRAAALFGFVAAAILLAANAAAIHVFRELHNEFDARMELRGLSSSLGVAPFVLGWVAWFLVVCASVAVCLQPSTKKRGSGLRELNLGGAEKSSAKASVGGGNGGGGAAGILGRIPGLKRHKYVQLEKQNQHQPTMQAHDRFAPQPYGIDADWDQDDEYSTRQRGYGRHGDDIAMRSLSSSPPARPRADTAYEPYSGRP